MGTLGVPGLVRLRSGLSCTRGPQASWPASIVTSPRTTQSDHLPEQARRPAVQRGTNVAMMPSRPGACGPALHRHRDRPRAGRGPAVQRGTNSPCESAVTKAAARTARILRKTEDQKKLGAGLSRDRPLVRGPTPLPSSVPAPCRSRKVGSLSLRIRPCGGPNALCVQMSLRGGGQKRRKFFRRPEKLSRVGLRERI